jgi:catechol 2,3-dioxygenase-like lactoylglutathione lyase family enzyme
MSRVQLALNVSDLDAAVGFYTKLFQTAPAKIRPGYANFAIVEPPLKLILIEGAGTPGSLNHLGIEVMSVPEVTDASDRLTSAGLVERVEKESTCCYAVQDKVWTADPDGAPWEVYTVLADADTMLPPGSDCCAPTGEKPMCCGPTTS